MNSLQKLPGFFLALVLLWLGFKYALPILMPFVLAGLLALAAEPLVSTLEKRSFVKRGIAAGIGVSITLVLLLGVITALVALLVRQLGKVSSALPGLVDTAQAGLGSLEHWLLSLSQKTPKSIQPMVSKGVSDLFSDSSALLEQITGWLLGLASGILTQIPDSLFGFGTWLLACYMISAKLPQLRQWLSSHLPERWRNGYLPMLNQLRQTVGKWFLAQFKLISVTFCVLCLGFLLLQIPYAPLWAMLISLVDALPILGTGMVLAPWSLVCFLQNDSVRGIGLLGIWAAGSLLRSVLEPRMVGKQLGLDPLVTLLSLYVGYRIWGFGGMVAAPLLAVAVFGLFQGNFSGKNRKKPL